jgi:hypothetical protein
MPPKRSHLDLIADQNIGAEDDDEAPAATSSSPPKKKTRGRGKKNREFWPMYTVTEPCPLFNYS